MNKKQRMYERIERHGRQLLAMYPNATEQDPIKLCKKLRRIEARANRLAVDYCNGDIGCHQSEVQFEKIEQAVVDVLLPVTRESIPFVNRDPRGYALKVNLQQGQELHRDWGGYGIIAPDLTE